MVTQIEAKEMRDAIRVLEEMEVVTRRRDFRAEMATVQTWYDAIKKPVPTTRTQALEKVNHIKSLLQTETNFNRLTFLSTELKEANEKYKEVKKVNPNS